MNLILPISVKIAGSLANADALPLLADPTNAFGVRRTDTNATIAAAGTAMVAQTTGIYTYTVTDATPGVSYEFWPTPIINGVPYKFQKFLRARDENFESYLASDEADAIASSFPGLANYKGATSDVKTAALLLATIDIDAAMRYQGCRFCPRQKLEFPRIAYDVSRGYSYFSPAVNSSGDPFFAPFSLSGMVIWELDADLLHAHVPHKVRLATLIQADSIIAGDRDARIQDIVDGLVEQQVGSLMEQYRINAEPSRLCDRACRIMEFYRIRQGRIL